MQTRTLSQNLVMVAGSVALLVISSVWGGEIWAVEEKKSVVKKWLQQLDKDGDGRISREEAKAGPAWMSKKFDQIDTDGDGHLSPDELGKHRKSWMAQKRTEKWFSQLDQDGDGRIDREEAKAGPGWIGEKFDDIDTDKDGAISREELHDHIKQWLQKQCAKRKDT